MAGTQARRRWLAAGWMFAVLATTVNGVVVGYGALWFQFFGDTADAEDYAVSAGGYAAAAFVLALAVPAILTHRAAPWLAWFAGSSAAILGLLAVGSILNRADAEPVSSPANTAWDGIGGVIWAPWTWVLVVLGLRGLGLLVVSRRRETD